MPFVNIKITREKVTAQQKAELIRGATELLSRVLKKDPQRTMVLIEELDPDGWGLGGISSTEHRKRTKVAQAQVARGPGGGK